MDNLSPINDISSYAFDELFTRYNSLETERLLVYLVDNIDSSVLPHLAEQFHVMGNEGWLQVKTDEEKRRLIKEAINIHRYKGTKYSILKVLEMLNLEGKVKEWFEYAGQPYHFKVEAGFANRGADEAIVSRLRDLVLEYKNERSFLESLEIFLINTCSAPKYGLKTITGDVIKVEPIPESFVFDDDNWDEKNWSSKPILNTRTEPIFWNQDDWDVEGWAFG